MKKKVILFDIETSLALMGSFSLYPEAIPHSNVIQDWYIICIAWKELGSDKVHSVSTSDIDDKKVCLKIKEVLDGADMVIGHNLDRFDVKKLNARLMYHGIEPMKPLITLDTLKEIKKIASFTSHKLDYLGSVLCDDKKMSTSPGLWMRVLRGDKKAVKEMVEYCKQDVLLLEKLYLRTRKYYKSHPNLASPGVPNCTTCGSHKITKSGLRTLKGGSRVQRYVCSDCGSWSQGRLTIEKPELK